MNYYHLVKQHPQHLGFGFLHYFFSMPGQSMLISLFIPHFNARLDMNNEAFGVLYSIATLISAFTIPLVGGLIDRYKIRYLSVLNGILLFLFTWVISYATSQVILFIGIVGLRFTGQGMMTLLASTAISRYFDIDRGKALSLSGLGLSLGEALMPVIVVAAIAGFNWEVAWRLLGCSVLLVFIPLSVVLVRKNDAFQLPDYEQNSLQSEEVISRKKVLREARFYAVLFPAVFPALVLTGLFIHQNLVATNKGWSMEWMAACFIGFGIVKIITYFLAGPLVDRFTARRVFPFFLIPLALGLVVLVFFNHPLAALLYLLLAGISNALSAVLGSAIWAELYGVRNLGSIKSALSTFFVAATSVGAILFGWLLSEEQWMKWTLMFTVALMLLASIVARRALK
jgi:MFS family permease